MVGCLLSQSRTLRSTALSWCGCRVSRQAVTACLRPLRQRKVNAACAHQPTFTGASLTTKGKSFFTFRTADFPFENVDAGDTLGAIKGVTSLPAHGTLKLVNTLVTFVPSATIPLDGQAAAGLNDGANHYDTDDIQR